MPTARLVTILLIVVVSIGAFLFTYMTGQYAEDSNTQQVSGPKIGGPFELVNQDGMTVTQADYEGKYLLVFFGYTYCPDVCPLTLTKVASVLDMLGESEATKVQALFITVDPARDTPQHLKDYVTYFHPSIVGLTGSQEQIDAVAKAYGVYYAKGEAAEDDPESYAMDHTAITYLMNPDGTYAAHFSHSGSAEDMVAGIRRVLENE